MAFFCGAIARILAASQVTDTILESPTKNTVGTPSRRFILAVTFIFATVSLIFNYGIIASQKGHYLNYFNWVPCSVNHCFLLHYCLNFWLLKINYLYQ